MDLKQQIEAAAARLAEQITTAIVESPLIELAGMARGAEAGSVVAKSEEIPSSPEKSRKRGRPRGTKKIEVRQVRRGKVRVVKRRKTAWPKCKHPGCEKNAWRRGHGFCGKHAKRIMNPIRKPRPPRTPDKSKIVKIAKTPKIAKPRPMAIPPAATKREQVLALLRAGERASEIAQKVGLSSAAVRGIKKRAMK